MQLAISNNLSNLSVTSDASSSNIDNVLDYTFNNKYISDGTSVTFEITASAGSYTYVGLSGHNLGDVNAEITIVNHGVVDVSNYNVLDNRTLMFIVPPRSGGVNDLVITINKTSSANVVLSHVAAGLATDLTGQTDSGQNVRSDYEGGYQRIPLNVPRKVKSTSNQDGAPTATLIKTVSQKLSLSLSNVPTKFAREDLIAYQRFWTESGFFIQNDDDPGQSYLAYEFIPTSPTAHRQTRELVSIKYNFVGYNGQ